jgi:5'-3' exonuclease
MIEFEADDAIASAAALAEADPAVERVIIVSPDKDFAQCVRGQRVMCLDRQRKRQLDQAAVVERFGILPESIPDYLALVGDTADGIPGLPGWGARSTALVLGRYRHLEEIPADPAAWEVKVRGARNLASTLATGRQAALLYRKLATLRRDAPLGIASPAELAWHGPRADLLEPLCASIGDRGFLDQIPSA